jgi:biotin synthase
MTTTPTTPTTPADFPARLAEQALANEPLTDEQCRRVLADDSLDLMDLLHAAYRVRKARFGKVVQVHILNNAQNGNCPEDCSYCAQARTADTDIEPYPIKSDDEVFEEARRAYEAGAHRYCMVFAGRGPNNRRTDKLVSLIEEIKRRYPLEVCVSAGLLDDDKAARLKAAGLDRYNHNLNTSRDNYAKICTTHTYDDRVRTLEAAKNVGMDVCSGLIVGMGETHDELVELAQTLARFHAESIPVNFLLPIEGITLPDRQRGELTPEFCLRVLALFRFTNPEADVRAAAGREYHLKSLEPLCLLPANSIFLDGYLNGRGAERRRTYQMIKDTGFTLESEHGLDDLLEDIPADTDPTQKPQDLTVNGNTPALKRSEELRPALAGKA